MLIISKIYSLQRYYSLLRGCLFLVFFLYLAGYTHSWLHLNETLADCSVEHEEHCGNMSAVGAKISLPLP